MIEVQNETKQLDSIPVNVSRTAATIKGGRRFSFGALVVMGDRQGQVGIGYGKANEVPPAIEKGEKEARRSLKKVVLKDGTIPHTVIGRFGASRVKLVPASPGTGIVAGITVRSVLELVGLRDCLTKAYGSTNKVNLVKATLNGLMSLRSKEQVESLRGIEIETTHVEDLLHRGQAYLPQVIKPQVAVSDTDNEKGGSTDNDEKNKIRTRRGKPVNTRPETTRTDAPIVDDNTAAPENNETTLPESTETPE